MHLWPKSLLGQVVLAVTLALLVGQAISAILLWQAAENRRENSMLHAAALQLLREPNPSISEELRLDRRELRQKLRRSGPRRTAIDKPPSPRPRSMALEWRDTSPLLPGEHRDSNRESELATILAVQETAPAEVLVVERTMSTDPMALDRPRLQARLARNNAQDQPLLIAAIRRTPDGQWAVARVRNPPIPSGVIYGIIFRVVVTLAVLLIVMFWLLRRITRPLAILTERTEHFAQTQEPAEPLAAEGPADIKHLITAHNRMEARIAALLDEKDVMLGAIGHDLKTPLTALRVRIESVEDDGERAKMASSIEDITRSLDDILSLARIGRNQGSAEKTDISALVASVVEEFEDMGEAVTLDQTERITAPVHITWLRRALRNLISNAVRYGGGARVSLRAENSAIILRVDDDGPGIPADQISAMTEPFTRGETSRNRDTGGAGLGLTLARAIAEQHGGELILTNREEGGLRAEINLP